MLVAERERIFQGLSSSKLTGSLFETELGTASDGTRQDLLITGK